MPINFEDVFENSPIGLLVLENPSGWIIKANRSACALLSVQPDKLWGVPWADLLKKPSADHVKWSDGVVRELEILSPSGAQLTFDAAFSLLPGDQKDMSYLMVALMPCAERLAMESERNSLAVEKQRELKLKALGRLSGGMAHDFNNLLTVISGNMELLSGGDGVDKVLLDDCNSALDRAQDLAKQILQFSKNPAAPKGEVELRSALELICNMVRRAWHNEGQPSFCSEVASATVNLSAAEFEAAIMNLLSNAKEASDDDDLNISVSLDLFNLTKTKSFLCGHLQAGEYACVSVEDKGSGISDEIKEHLFEPYFSTKEGEGNGIGLSRVDGLMQSIGGAIDMESIPGEGTRWTLFFPLVKAEAKALPTSSPAKLEHPMIAVVDDEESIVRLVGRVLEREGYASKGFSKPKEALAYLSSQNDHFVLVTDARMPGLSGRALTDALRSARKRFSALLLSGYSDELAGKEGLFNERLQKPVRINELLEAVKRLCRSMRN